jgi:hypothetical protein
VTFAINQDGSFPEIGEKYDIGIATRDGTSLTCLNKDGALVSVPRIAYMLSSDKNNKYKESTELQEKQKLVQLGTSTSIDREFDQWVQNTQGDWSAGIGQRVYGQQGVTNAYFDGEGLLWPINDWIPQTALRGPTQGLPAATIAGPPSQADFGTSVITPGGALSPIQAYGAIASFKASGGAVARVGAAGAFTTGTNTAVTPPWGQATTAGNFGCAFVTGQRQTGGGGPGNIGNTGGATYSWDFSQVNSDNVIGTAETYTVPGGGIYVNSISIYMGGYSAAVTVEFAIWNASTGALIVASAATSVGQGLSLKTLNVAQTFIAAGTSIRVGFWRQQNQDAMWGVGSSGSFNFATNQSGVVNPTSGCTSPYVCGHIQAYASYTTTQTSDITASAGWVLVAQSNSPDANQQLQIWKKENLAGGDAAPTFTAAVGVRVMHAQVAEFTHIATANAIDSSATGSASSQSSLTVTNAAADSVAGDLVVTAYGWQLN